MLKRVRIKGYKSLKDVEVHLQPLSVLFGANASGKSNLLDALQLLSAIATSPTLQQASDPPYRGTPLESFSFGPEGIKSLLQQDKASFSIEVDIELSPKTIETVNRQISALTKEKPNERGTEVTSSEVDGVREQYVREKYFRYYIEIEISPQSGRLLAANQYLRFLGTNNPDILIEQISSTQFSVRQIGRQFYTGSDSIKDYSLLSIIYSPQNHPYLFAVSQELSSWSFLYLEPRQRMREPNPVREVKHLGAMGEQLAAFLNTLRHTDRLQFRAIEKSLNLLVPSITGIDVGINESGIVELKLLQDNIAIPARLVSEGTLRILGLLAMGGIKDSPALLGFEEPETGIHPRQMRAIARLLETYANRGDTQLIVTTHSPILPDLVPADSLYLCSLDNGNTSIQPLSSLGLPEQNEESLLVSERILRGDFDADY